MEKFTVPFVFASTSRIPRFINLFSNKILTLDDIYKAIEASKEKGANPGFINMSYAQEVELCKIDFPRTYYLRKDFNDHFLLTFDGIPIFSSEYGLTKCFKCDNQAIDCTRQGKIIPYCQEHKKLALMIEKLEESR